LDLDIWASMQTLVGMHWERRKDVPTSIGELDLWKQKKKSCRIRGSGRGGCGAAAWDLALYLRKWWIA
jgi:hypothetical protein